MVYSAFIFEKTRAFQMHSRTLDGLKQQLNEYIKCKDLKAETKIKIPY